MHIKNKPHCLDCPLSNVCIPKGVPINKVSYVTDAVIKNIVIKKKDYLFRERDKFIRIYAIRSGSFKCFSVLFLIMWEGFDASL